MNFCAILEQERSTRLPHSFPLWRCRARAQATLQQGGEEVGGAAWEQPLLPQQPPVPPRGLRPRPKSAATRVDCRASAAARAAPGAAPRGLCPQPQAWGVLSWSSAPGDALRRSEPQRWCVRGAIPLAPQWKLTVCAPAPSFPPPLRSAARDVSQMRWEPRRYGTTRRCGFPAACGGPPRRAAHGCTRGLALRWRRCACPPTGPATPTP